jgi:hypothetical protein
MKSLLVGTAALEVVTGLGLLAAPAEIVSSLLGGEPDTPVNFVVARVAGAALVALALACWGARIEPRSQAAAGVVTAMLAYNAIVAAVLVYAGTRLELSGPGLWPAVGLHLALAAWCVACLRIKHRDVGAQRNQHQPPAAEQAGR